MKYWIICICLIFYLSCGTIPHYEEKTVASDKMTFPGISPDDIWEGVISTLAEMKYIVVNTDKEAGHIYAECDEAYWSRSGRGAVNILVKGENSGTSVTCHMRGTYMVVDPHKETEKFFSALKNILNEKEKAVG